MLGYAETQLLCVVLSEHDPATAFAYILLEPGNAEQICPAFMFVPLLVKNAYQGPGLVSDGPCRLMQAPLFHTHAYPPLTLV